MKLLATIDKHILAYWNTAPDERLCAYLATLPVAVLVIDAVAQIIK
ncbi:hypothetical protein [Limosilactobacillus fastidiosus]|uniref:Uncharacterized protein n=1 Tax=Limosilactobacillus fastidiosus TaxID=2759855 RepID=A0A7W3YD56_9LACO|nr:hypothetical protein [Limosilactobacillus fastidiosus]MBB1086821.1 hypothetical protein [Limosilactobacillus fastidiosus]MCD7085452.1 hypothetical protein [Limosilactobacillus fastidiosus]MCD7114683.1 hypothetical protein [Limosilactobacillus fastidiosus]MCD7116068.1 hypothetical protein [Limosilactobacillus fastidiosus]